MIGDSSVGKTSLVLRYDKRGFNLRFTTTIGVDYSDRLLELDGRSVKLQVSTLRVLTTTTISKCDVYPPSCLRVEFGSEANFLFRVM